MAETEKKDYRHTVLTPKTDFPMRARLPEREPERLAQWEQARLYEQTLENRRDAPTFILHDGPPYANGDIHLGHALNKILKDVIVRYQTMKGRRAPYIPGWDCHGLPIEQQVMKKLGPKLHEMEPAAIRRLCRDYAQQYINVQRKQFKRLGVTGDWDRPYTTFDPAYEVGILKTLRELVARGLVRKGMKPVHWDPVFRTALAEAEIEYETHESDSIYVSFPVRDADRLEPFRGLENVALVIWTTTPWTLPANLAVCLHPDFEYVIVKHDGRHDVVAKELVESFAQACGIGEYEIAGSFKAGAIERAECDHPIFPDKSSLVILGNHVTTEAGTGCVHTAPGHGMDDYLIGRQYDLPVFVPVDDRGCFTSDYPEMEGTFVFDANARIIENLREKGILLGASKFVHEYPHSWRSHKPIVFRATEQWFMELGEGDVRAKALRAIEEDVQWIPPWGRERIRAMVAQRPDWCLSRQRSWGVPIPSIRSKKSGQSVLDVRIIDAFIARVAEKGTDAWFAEPLEAFWPEGFVHEETGESRPEDFEKERDILDVWFDSGASHVAVLEQDERVDSPADLYLEGSDQHRGWFQSALLTSIGARDRAPYRAVLTHGFVLDGQGKAMSKSAGNVISPLDLMAKRGADILRMWVCSEDYRNDVRVSPEIMDRIAEAYRRIRNAMRFLIGNLHDFDAEKHRVEPGKLEEIDRWILGQMADLIEDTDLDYRNYQFHRVFHRIYDFCNTQLSMVYLDVTKDRLYCSAPDDPPRRAAQTAIFCLLENLTRLLAPIMVFTADEVWETAGFGSQSIHLTDFPSAKPEWRDADLARKWEALLELRDEVSVVLEEARRAKTIGHSLDAALTLHPRNDREDDFFTENLALLKMLFIVSQVAVGEKAPGEAPADRAEVAPAAGKKCERCWMKDPGVGNDEEHPGLCPRCSDVINRWKDA